MDGLFLENGPFLINERGEITRRKHSWNEYANMLYIDQPVGTGYSYSTDDSYDKNMNQVQEHLETFYQSFLKLFPQFKNADLYFTGESYAGTYIPYFATYFIQKGYKIKGIAIGNGWMDPRYQYKALITFAEQHSLLTGQFLIRGKALMNQCQKEIDRYPNRGKHDTCELITHVIEDQSKSGGKLCLNVYDIRLRDLKPDDECGMGWPFDLPYAKLYLSRSDVQAALHIDRPLKVWTECSREVQYNLESFQTNHSAGLLPSLLEKTSVYLFSGDMDLGCNWIGVNDMVDNLEFNGTKGVSKPVDWYVNNTLAGTWASSGNLNVFVVYNASHMVPIDAPLPAQEVLHKLIGIDRGLSSFGNINIQPMDNTSIEIPKQIPVEKNTESWKVGFIALLPFFALLAFILVYKRRQNQTPRQDWQEVPLQDLGDVEDA